MEEYHGSRRTFARTAREKEFLPGRNRKAVGTASLLHFPRRERLHRSGGRNPGEIRKGPGNSVVSTLVRRRKTARSPEPREVESGRQIGMGQHGKRRPYTAQIPPAPRQGQRRGPEAAANDRAEDGEKKR